MYGSGKPFIACAFQVGRRGRGRWPRLASTEQRQAGRQASQKARGQVSSSKKRRLTGVSAAELIKIANAHSQILALAATLRVWTFPSQRITRDSPGLLNPPMTEICFNISRFDQMDIFSIWLQ